jgi:pyruvate,water dikinase
MTTAPGTACHLVWLDRSATSRTLVGGKGASLSHLADLGAPVPPAFALTTRAYAEFATALGLPQHALDIAEADLPAIRATIAGGRLPAPVAEALGHGFDAFHTRLNGHLALAVRSSATAEDSSDFSFAGLHDTILDVRTLPALENAVRQCWASLWSDRALAYRHAGGLAGDDASIAVVVQQLVRSDVSFVVFTTDPVTGRDGRLVISASWGLGEAIVSGLATPDHIVVGPDGQIDEYTIGDKAVMVIPGANPGDGTREAPTPRALRTAPALSPEQVFAIAATARDLAARLGYEADIEGAICDGTLHLFQARPITTLALGNSVSPDGLTLSPIHRIGVSRNGH